MEPLKQVPTKEVAPQVGEKEQPKSLQALQDLDQLSTVQESEPKIRPPTPQEPLSSIYDYEQDFPTMEKFSTIPPLTKQEKPHHSKHHH